MATLNSRIKQGSQSLSVPDPSIMVWKTAPDYAPKRRIDPAEIFAKNSDAGRLTGASAPAKWLDLVNRFNGDRSGGVLFGPKKTGRTESSHPKPGDPNYVDPSWPLL